MSSLLAEVLHTDRCQNYSLSPYSQWIPSHARNFIRDSLVDLKKYMSYVQTFRGILKIRFSVGTSLSGI